MDVTTDGSNPIRRIRLVPRTSDVVSVTRSGLEKLAASISAADNDPECRMIVLESAAGGFCHGMDLAAISGSDARSRSIGIERYVACVATLRAARTMVMVAIDGVAFGAGVGLAAAADFVVATETSRFGLPEVLLGLVPAIVLTPLLERMTPQKARRFALWGGSISADDAERDGLVDRVVATTEDLEATIRELLRQICRTDRDAIGAVKELCTRLPHVDPAHALEIGAQTTRERLASDRRRAAIRSFTETGTLPYRERSIR